MPKVVESASRIIRARRDSFALSHSQVARKESSTLNPTKGCGEKGGMADRGIHKMERAAWPDPKESSKDDREEENWSDITAGVSRRITSMIEK